MRIELKLRIRNSLEVSDHDVHKFHSVSHLVFHGGMNSGSVKYVHDVYQS